jgi:hypothetical protein
MFQDRLPQNEVEFSTSHQVSVYQFWIYIKIGVLNPWGAIDLPFMQFYRIMKLHTVVRMNNRVLSPRVRVWANSTGLTMSTSL